MTELSPVPLHYRGDSGAWERIDNTLVRRGGIVRNRAGGYDATLPARLGGRPVRFALGERSLGFTLRGAAAVAATVRGSQARYVDAFPGVDVVYEATAVGLKETFELARAGTLSRFRFDLDLPAGTTPRLDASGGIAIVAADGSPRMIIAPPFMADAAGERSGRVSYALASGAESGWTLDVIADEAWLAAEDRRYPVAIDPTVVSSPTHACVIMARPSPFFLDAGGVCESHPEAFLEIGYHSSLDLTYVARPLLYWDLSAIPDTADVTAAAVDSTRDVTWYCPLNDDCDAALTAYPLTRAFADTPTWTDYDGTNPWTALGGDFDAGSGVSVLADDEQPWDIEAIAQGWVDGSRPNHGLIVIPEDDALNGPSFVTGWLQMPTLTVTYESDEEPDVTPPSVQIVAPTDGAAVAGDVGIEVDANDAAGVVEVELEIDGDPLTELEDEPWTAVWDSTEVADGVHEVAAIARDAAGNSARSEIEVHVQNDDLEGPPVDATTSTSLAAVAEFLYTGPDPVQTGVTPGALRDEHIAVLRGHVMDRGGSGIGDVEVSVVGHPEIGTTTTRGSGDFALAVNGGGPLTVRLAKSGFLPVERQVESGWQDYAWVDDVVLVPLDTQVTSVDSDSPVAQVARGSVVADDDGPRQATLLFPAGTTATMTLPSGLSVPVDELDVRATEYTVGDDGPAAMPGELPATSAYTYAVEYTVDAALDAQATRVDFDRPVVAYTDNFLDFPVGEPVPSGYYDRELGRWLPTESGRVIAILGETGGEATVDVDGDGVAATQPALDALGIDEDELEQLAALYAPGDSLWRVAITHFTPYDFNWSFGLPAGARGPSALFPTLPERLDEPCDTCGSVIGTEDQTFGERLELPGIPLELSYDSGRQRGRIDNRRVTIAVTGDTLPAAMKGAHAEIVIAGRRYTADFAALPNQSFTIDWDGRDAFGREVQGAQPVKSKVEYRYDADYSSTALFAVPGSATLTTNPARGELTLAREQTDTVGVLDAATVGLGGWTLEDHHAYDPVSRVVHFGDGGRRSTDLAGLDGAARTLAGTGDAGFDSNVIATEAALNEPSDVLALADGSVLIADAENARVRKVDAYGEISTVAGTGTEGSDGDGGPADEAELNEPVDLDSGPRGEVFILDSAETRVRRIDADGRITTVVSGLDEPTAIAATPDGVLFVAEEAQVLRIGADGQQTPYAGTGTAGFAGDGGRAVDAQLEETIAGLAVAPDGALLIADTVNQRIRRVAPDGIISTVAGGGVTTVNAAGVPALQAQVGWVGRLTAERNGTVRFDDGSGFLLAVHPSGTVSTFAGAERVVPTFAATQASAGERPFERVGGLSVLPDGDVLVAEPGTQRVLRIARALPQFNGSALSIASGDGTEVYEFDADGRHLRTLQALTGDPMLTFSYDAAGRLSEVEDAYGDATQIERDGQGKPTAIVGPFGARAELETGAGGLLTAVTDNADREWGLGYTAGLMTSIVNPRGDEWTMLYDADGRLLREDDPDGGEQVLAPQAGSARSTSVTDPSGAGAVFSVTSAGSDGVSRTASDDTGASISGRTRANGAEEMTLPDGTGVTTRESTDPRFGTQSPFTSRQVVTTPGELRLETTTGLQAQLGDADDPFSLELLTETTTVNGRPSTSVYDADTRLETETSAAGRVVETTYNAHGLPVQSQVAGRDPVVTDYDAHGRVTSFTYGADELELVYDAAGNVVGRTDALGRETTAEYDDAGQLTRLQLPGGGTIEYEYDAAGNLTSLQPPGRDPHLSEFSATGLLLRTEEPATDGTGPAVTEYEYDDAQQLERVSLPDGSDMELEYDAAGRLETVTGTGGTHEYGYDSASRQTSLEGPGNVRVETDYDGGLPVEVRTSGDVAGVVELGYDDNFNLTSSTVGTASAVTFGYDDDDLLTRAGALDLTRDPTNATFTATELDEIQTTSDHSTRGLTERIEAVGPAGTLFEQTVDRGTAGRIEGETLETPAGTTALEYAYDPAGRLAQVHQNGSLAVTYQYDANGNRTLEERPGQPDVASTYDARDRLVSRGTSTYAYSRTGTLQSRTTGAGTTAYEYNAFGDLTAVELPGGTEIEYVIDGAGGRVGRKRNGVWTQRFVRGLDQGPAAEVDATGDVLTRFVYGMRPHVPEYMVRGGQTYRFVLDRLGSVRLVVNADTGVIAQQLEYDPWGQVLSDTAPGFQPFGFAGGLYDHETGLVRLGARDYDPEIGRWTAPDPQGFAGGDANLYAYVVGDPVNSVDTLGLGFWMDVSETSAGALNELTLGASNRLAGIDDIDSDSYRAGGFLGALNPKGAVKAVGKRAASIVSRKSSSQIKKNARKGKRGEKRNGATGAREAIKGCPSGKRRYPDILNHRQRLLGEIKNVNELSYTSQLRDYVWYAKRNNYTFVLTVRRGIWPFIKETKLSGPLRDAIARGDIMLRKSIMF